MKRLVFLVVEDTRAVRRFITCALRHYGFRVMEAESAAQAREVVRNLGGAVSLVITDVVMPCVSGLDLAAELNREYPDLKILYMSGYGESIAIRGILSIAPQLVLVKPFTEELLLNRVRELCL
jgi:two-component system, cell cycle sensor histidine kinase and response regulator CckA